MYEKLEKKEKKKIFIYLVVTFVIVSFLVAFLIFYNKIFIMEYSFDDIVFYYPSNFKVRKKDDMIKVISKDKIANIEIIVEENDVIYQSLEYSSISNGIFSDAVDLEKFKNLSSECIDHMCTNLYESDKDMLKIVVEFRENILVIYKYQVSKAKFDKYNDGFNTVVNSFTVALTEED